MRRTRANRAQILRGAYAVNGLARVENHPFDHVDPCGRKKVFDKLPIVDQGAWVSPWPARSDHRTHGLLKVKERLPTLRIEQPENDIARR